MSISRTVTIHSADNTNALVTPITPGGPREAPVPVGQGARAAFWSLKEAGENTFTVTLKGTAPDLPSWIVTSVCSKPLKRRILTRNLYRTRISMCLTCLHRTNSVLNPQVIAFIRKWVKTRCRKEYNFLSGLESLIKIYFWPLTSALVHK